MWLVSRVVLVAKQASAPTTHWAPTRALGSAARAATTLVVIRIVRIVGEPDYGSYGLLLKSGAIG